MDKIQLVPIAGCTPKQVTMARNVVFPKTDVRLFGDIERPAMKAFLQCTSINLQDDQIFKDMVCGKGKDGKGRVKIVVQEVYDKFCELDTAECDTDCEKTPGKGAQSYCGPDIDGALFMDSECSELQGDDRCVQIGIAPERAEGTDSVHIDQVKQVKGLMWKDRICADTSDPSQMISHLQHMAAAEMKIMAKARQVIYEHLCQCYNDCFENLDKPDSDKVNHILKNSYGGNAYYDYDRGCFVVKKMRGKKAYEAKAGLLYADKACKLNLFSSNNKFIDGCFFNHIKIDEANRRGNCCYLDPTWDGMNLEIVEGGADSFACDKFGQFWAVPKNMISIIPYSTLGDVAKLKSRNFNANVNPTIDRPLWFGGTRDPITNNLDQYTIGYSKSIGCSYTRCVVPTRVDGNGTIVTNGVARNEENRPFTIDIYLKRECTCDGEYCNIMWAKLRWRTFKSPRSKCDIRKYWGAHKIISEDALAAA